MTIFEHLVVRHSPALEHLEKWFKAVKQTETSAFGKSTTGNVAMCTFLPVHARKAALLAAPHQQLHHRPLFHTTSRPYTSHTSSIAEGPGVPVRSSSRECSSVACLCLTAFIRFASLSAEFGFGCSCMLSGAPPAFPSLDSPTMRARCFLASCMPESRSSRLRSECCRLCGLGSLPAAMSSLRTCSRTRLATHVTAP
eukprot:593749-Rhodomonas_salina.2